MFNERWETYLCFRRERLNRIKHWAGIPFRSISECLKYEKINLKDINVITVNSNPYSNIKEKIFYTINSKNLINDVSSFFKRQSKKLSLKKIRKYFKTSIKGKIIRYDYQYHIASSYYLSGLRTQSKSIDGFGDFCSLANPTCQNNKIEILAKNFLS